MNVILGIKKLIFLGVGSFFFHYEITDMTLRGMGFVKLIWLGLVGV